MDNLQNITEGPYVLSDTDPPAPKHPSPNDPPWNVLTATGVWVVSVLLILLVPSLFLLAYAMRLDPPIREASALVEFAKSDPNAILVQVISVIPVHLLTVLLAWVVVTRNRKYSFWEMVGARSGGVRWWHFVLIIACFFVLAKVAQVYVTEPDTDITRILKSSRAALLVVAVIATFSAPFIEEIVYRGILYSAFQRSFGATAAVVIVTLLFAGVHVPQYIESPVTIAFIFILSIVLTVMRARSKNLLPCILFHMVFNGLQSVGFVLESFAAKPEVQDQAASLLHLVK